MYWEYSGEKTLCPIIPFVTAGTAFDLTLQLVTEAGETFTDVFLCTPETTGRGDLYAKRSTDTTYLAIGGLLDAFCLIGGLDESTSTDIDFRILADTDGYYVLPVLVIAGDGLIELNVSEFWQDDATGVTATEELWQDDEIDDDEITEFWQDVSPTV